jgi:hypothetical protein
MPHDHLPVPDTPRDTVLAAFTAYEAGRWREFAALVDDEALAELRRHQLAMAEGWERFPVGIEHDVGSMSDSGGTALDAEVAELASQMSGMGNPALHLFRGVTTVEELRALEPAELLARFLEGSAPRPNPDDPEYQPPVSRRTIIGEVAETPDLVHVVYRVHTDVGRHGHTDAVAVVPMHRTQHGWRLVLNDELSFAGWMRTSHGMAEDR